MLRRVRWLLLAGMATIAVCCASAGALTATPAAADTCSPQLTSITPVSTAQTQTVTINGTCLGTQAAYSNGDSNYLALHDNRSAGAWSACSTNAYNGLGANQVTCSVSSWTESSITITSFDGTYGSDYTFANGDPLQFNIYNASDGQGPAQCTVTVGASQTMLCNPGDPSAGVFGSGEAVRHNDTCSGGDGSVNCATGDMNDSFTDVNVPGPGGGLDLSRTYNSLGAGLTGPFGEDWSCSYCWTLTPESSGGVTITEGDGSQVYAALSQSGAYTIPSIDDSTLSENADGSWKFVRQQGDAYVFNSSGQLTSITDPNGYTTTLAYSSGQLSSVTNSDGQSLSIVENAAGEITSVTDPLGLTTQYTYSSGELTSATNSDGDAWQYQYNAAGDLTVMTDPDGNTITSTFDPENRVLTQTASDNAETQWSYSGDPFSAAGGTTVITDPDGNQEQQQYTNGQLIALTKGYGTSGAQTWDYGYDATTGGMTSLKDPNGNTTTFTYDANGNRLTETDPSGDETQWTYNALDEPLSIEQPTGVTTTNTYNADGDLLTSSTPLLNSSGSTLSTQQTQYTYGNSGLPGYPTAVEDPDNNTTTYSYGSRGQLTSSTDAQGDETSYSYDSDGRELTETAPNGNVSGCGCASQHTTTYTYNALSEPLTTTDADGNKTSYAYDPNGNQTSETNPDQTKTLTTYNDLNEPLQQQSLNPSGAVLQTTASGYDPDGNLTSQTNGRSDKTTYAYNALGQEASSTDPLNETTNYAYDPDGNLQTETTPDSKTITDSYNTDDELTGTTYSSGSPSAIGYSYDADGRMTGMTDQTGTSAWTYNSLGDLTSHTNGAGAEVQYGYDLAGNMTSLTYPAAAGDVVDYGYNAADEMTSEQDWLGNTNSFSYDADGNLTKTTLANATIDASTYNGDDDELSSSIAPTAAPTATVASFAYTYNSDNETASETDTSEPGPSAGNNDPTFAYDQSGDLTALNGNSGFVYNADGELTAAPASADPSQSSPAAMSYAYNALGERITETPSGQTPYSLAYNQAGELTNVTNGSTTLASDTYDGSGLRASETAGGTTYGFAYDTAADTPLILTDGQNNYIYGPSSTPIEQISTSGNPLYLYHDALGSVRRILNQSGSTVASTTYTPYGTPAASTGTTTSPFGYAGAYTDPTTGQLYLDNRYYDPNTGQFLTLDPLVQQTGQPYQYVDGDPVDAKDPTGLDVEAAAGGVIDDGDETPSPSSPGTPGNGSGDATGASTPTAATGTEPADPTSPLTIAVEGRQSCPAALPTPVVEDPKLQNIVNDLYKGTTNANRVGNGTTADAVRSELTTGEPTGGVFHTTKAAEYSRALVKLIQGGTLSPSDQTVARSLLNDLQDALGN